MVEKFIIDEFITVDGLYDELHFLNDILSQEYVSEVCVSFEKVNYVCPDAIIPLQRALVVFDSVLRKKNQKGILIEEGDSNAVLYLYHIGFFDEFIDKEAISCEQTKRFEYLLYNRKFYQDNRIMRFENKYSYVKRIEEENPELFSEVKNDTKGLNRYIRDCIDSIVHQRIWYTYSSTREILRKSYGGDFVEIVFGALSEITANAIVHGERESFLYFQTGAFLPSFAKYEREKMKGILVSVGDIGVGFKKSLEVKEEQERCYYREFHKINNSNWGVQDCESFSDIKRRLYENLNVIFEVLFYSSYKQEIETRYGLLEMINKIVLWEGRVSFYYENCRIMIDRKIEKVSEFAYTYINYFLDGNEKYVSCLPKRIPGVQVDIEIVDREKKNDIVD